MTSGHPELVAAITAEIATSGSMTFARFMELALYHPQFGYYTNPECAADRIGFSGDYYTTADVHPVMAQAVARQIVQVDELLGHPDPFFIIEMGPGKGRFAHDALEALRTGSHGLHQRLQYLLVERSAALQRVQRRTLATVDERVTWIEGLHVLNPDSVVGVLVSNELVDAFPVHRVRMQQGQAQEIYVHTIPDGGFGEGLGPVSCPELTVYLTRLRDAGITLTEGSTAEVNLDACRWIEAVGRVMGRGIVLTIDYGHRAHDLYGPERPQGTLLCYRQQMVSTNPYEYVGWQDMTAHVDFSMLASVGEQVGLQTTGFTNQMSFLIGLGVEQMLETLEPGTPEFQSIVHLLRPEGMGRTFKVLVQHKGLVHPELDGLRYKPFFGSALASACSGSE